MGLALRFRAIKVEHFTEEMRRDPAFAAIARKLTRHARRRTSTGSIRNCARRG